MVHYPSFLVGSAVAGTAFLIVHQQLSHRSRMTKRWKLREMAEQGVVDAWDQIRKPRGSNDASQRQSEYASSLWQSWNRGVSHVQDALRRDESTKR